MDPERSTRSAAVHNFGTENNQISQGGSPLGGLPFLLQDTMEIMREDKSETESGQNILDKYRGLQ